MSNGSSIPGPKPPKAPVLLRNKSSVFSELPERKSVAGAVNFSSEDLLDRPFVRLDINLSRPTSEIAIEASVVANFAIEESKTVGGLGITLFTLGALIAASPWSWIGALLFGPVRVWSFFHGVAIGGIGSALGMFFLSLLFVSVLVIFVIGWLIFRMLV